MRLFLNRVEGLAGRSGHGTERSGSSEAFGLICDLPGVWPFSSREFGLGIRSERVCLMRAMLS